MRLPGTTTRLRGAGVKLSANVAPKMGTTAMRRRTAATTSAAAEEGKLVYAGGFDTMLKYLKRVSIFSCACTVVGVPALAVASENERMGPWQRAALSFVVVSFGITTTAVLHVVAKPYVTSIRFNPATSEMTVAQLNMWGKPVTARVALSDVRPADRAWATFQTATEPRRSFFVETDAESYRDAEFRALLLGKVSKGSAPKSSSSSTSR